MSARYYVQGDELWMISAPGANGNDSPVMHMAWNRFACCRERNNIVFADVVQALRDNGQCEPEDRVAE